MNISVKQKQTHRHREQTCGCQGLGGGVGRELGKASKRVQTFIWKINKV